MTPSELRTHRDEVVAAYLGGATMAEVAQQWDASVDAVRAVLRDAGVQSRTGRTPAQTAQTAQKEARYAAIAAAVAAGASAAEVAAQHGVSDSTVRTAVRLAATAAPAQQAVDPTVLPLPPDVPRASTALRPGLRVEHRRCPRCGIRSLTWQRMGRLLWAVCDGCGATSGQPKPVPRPRRG